MFGSYNPYYVQPQMGRINQYTPPPQQPMYNNPTTGLQGKTVDSFEVVKAMDIPLDRKYKLFPISRWKCNSNKTITTRWNK